MRPAWTRRQALLGSLSAAGVVTLPFDAARAVEVAEDGMHKQPWFHQSFLDLKEDLAEAEALARILDAFRRELREDNLKLVEALREAIFSQMTAEHALTCQMICRITGQTDVLQNSPVMRRSIDRRNPYVDPLNYIQVALLRTLRVLSPDSPEHQRVLDAVLTTVNGIAAGMKTTG